MEQLERQHDGYIVPFDLYDGAVKKGDVYIKILSSSFYRHRQLDSIDYYICNEIVESWEKHYPEQTEETAKPDYSKVIELIEGDMERIVKNLDECVKNEAFVTAATLCGQRDVYNYLLAKIKAL